MSPPRIVLRLDTSSALAARAEQRATQAISGAQRAGLELGNDNPTIALLTQTATHDPLPAPVTQALSVVITHLLTLAAPGADSQGGR